MMDMLHGPLLGKMLQVAMPFAVSSILQQLFISIDVAVVGRFASSEALAAVGANTFLINLLINLFVGISVGANAVIAMAIGARDRHRVRNAVGTTCVIAIVCSLLLLIIGLAFAPTILRWMATPQEILSDATTYLRVYFLGVPFFIVFNFGAAILRSKGDTRRPLYMLLAAGVVNTLCCLLFVIVLHWSVAGVAAATGLSTARRPSVTAPHSGHRHPHRRAEHALLLQQRVCSNRHQQLRCRGHRRIVSGTEL